MGSTSVSPAPSVRAAEIPIKPRIIARGRSAPSAASQVLKDAPVTPLVSINVSKTLVAKLCGRGNDAAFHARVIAITRKLEPLFHAAGLVFFVAGVSLAFVADVPTRTAMSYTTASIGTCLWLYMAASLSWDMLVLVIKTFEFWFLFVVNATNLLLWGVLYHDERALAFTVTGANFALTLCTDANIYTRHFATRLTTLASPGLLAVLVVTVLRLAPDLHCPQYHIAGLTVDAVDLLLNGNLIITYFTAIRAYRSQHLVFSTATIQRVECDMYFPTCHLVPQGESRYASVQTSHTELPSATGANFLELVQYPLARGIDTADTILPRLAGCVEKHLSGRLVTILGLIGIAAPSVAFARLTMELDRGTGPPPSSLEWIGLLCTSLFFVVYASHWQPVLVKRICLEIDAWFVVLQVTLVSVGVCDALRWATRPSLLISTTWLWSLWLVFLDAVPVATRRRLTLSRAFVLITIMGLGSLPVVLAYWLYFSPQRATLVHDRVLLRVRVGRVGFEAKLLGFVASKLGPLWVWMGRFLWRELFRPRDAFKLIKRRVCFRVASCPVSLNDE